MKLRARAVLEDCGGYSVWMTQVSVKEPQQDQGQKKEYCEKLAIEINQKLQEAGLLWDK